MAGTGQQQVNIGTVSLCVEAVGHVEDSPILLLGAATWSMDWWEDDLCRQLAGAGRFVVRYDQRDTGASTSYPPGAPDYTGSDLVADALTVMDHFGLRQAHLVGLSMGGGLAQRMATEHPDRVASLTLVASSPVDGSTEDLPGPTDELLDVLARPAPEPDWSDREAVVTHVVEGERPFAGPGTFDEERLRRLAGKVFDRTTDMAASLTNHFLLEDGDGLGADPDRRSAAPRLVLHGTADPLFPLAHGHALAAAVPGSRLVELDGMGHQLPPPHLWDTVVAEIVAHTRHGGPGVARRHS